MPPNLKLGGGGAGPPPPPRFLRLCILQHVLPRCTILAITQTTTTSTKLETFVAQNPTVYLPLHFWTSLFQQSRKTSIWPKYLYHYYSCIVTLLGKEFLGTKEVGQFRRSQIAQQLFSISSCVWHVTYTVRVKASLLSCMQLPLYWPELFFSPYSLLYIIGWPGCLKLHALMLIYICTM